MSGYTALYGTVLLVLSLTAHAVEQVPQRTMKLTNRQFLAFSTEQQHWWFKGAFAQLSHYVGMNDAKQAACILDWIEDGTNDKKSLLLAYFKKYPDHAPTSVIISLLKRECGLG